jgi:hypothetical protein
MNLMAERVGFELSMPVESAQVIECQILPKSGTASVLRPVKEFGGA